MQASLVKVTILVLTLVSRSREQLLLSTLKQKAVNLLQHNIQDRNSPKASISFMMEMYRELQSESSLVRAAGRGNLNMADLTLSDTIRSFAPKVIQDSNTKSSNLQFDIPSISREEHLRIADIRYRAKSENEAVKRNLVMTISIQKGNCPVKQLTIRRVSERIKGYFVYDISRVVSPLVNYFHGNLTIKITSPQMKHNPQEQFAYMLNFYLGHPSYMKNLLKEQHKDPSYEIKSRGKRYIQNKRHHRNKQGKKAGKRRACQLYDFEVNFNIIGWGEWIIHPTRFNANQCFNANQGRCSSPIDIRHKPTNHAMLQSLMRSKQSKMIPSPCCVPTNLEPLSMMYFEYDEVVVRHHVDMIATECGCR